MAAQSGEVTVRYMLIRETHCRGFENRRSRTVNEWIADQELLPYNENNDAMAALISLKNSNRPGRLSENAQQLFHTACYDIDRFRQQVFVEGRWADLLSEDAPASARTDDVDMMKSGMAMVMNFFRKSGFGQEK
jgi:uncharacterized protein